DVRAVLGRNLKLPGARIEYGGVPVGAVRDLDDSSILPPEFEWHGCEGGRGRDEDTATEVGQRDGRCAASERQRPAGVDELERLAVGRSIHAGEFVRTCGRRGRPLRRRVLEGP